MDPPPKKLKISDIFEKLNLTSISHLRRCLILDIDRSDSQSPQGYSIVFDYNIIKPPSSRNRAQNNELIKERLENDSNFCHAVKESIKFSSTLSGFFGPQEFVCIRRKISRNSAIFDDLNNNQQHPHGLGPPPGSTGAVQVSRETSAEKPVPPTKRQSEVTIFCRHFRKMKWVLIFIADEGFKDDMHLENISKQLEPTVYDMNRQYLSYLRGKREQESRRRENH